MCAVEQLKQQLKQLLKQRLEEVAEDIFHLVEQTVSEYEEKLISEYNQQSLLSTPEGGFLVGASEHPSERPHFKEEQASGMTEDCGLKSEEMLSDPKWLNEYNSTQIQPAVRDVAESSEKRDLTVKTESTALTPPLHHSLTVAPPSLHGQTVPPLGGAVLQTTEKQLPQEQNTWTEEQLVENQAPNCAFSLSPSGAVLHSDSPGKLKKRRLGGKAQKRQHECPLCGLRFQSHFNLETHLRVHTGERPFSCPVCDKTFNRKDSMANHMKIHLGETFCCSECGKRYTDKSNLRRHTISMHTVKSHISRTAPESHVPVT